MPIFKYVAKDYEGKTVSAITEAKDQTTLVDLLRKRNSVIISVEEQAGKTAYRTVGGKIKTEELVIFSRQLATMVDSGIPLVQALDILSEQIENRSFRYCISKVRDDIETGSSLSEALAKHSKIFSTLFVNMVKAGESSGMLDEILDRLAGYIEKVSSLQRKVRSSLIYPALVVTIAIAITAFLLIKVVPTFKGIFESLGGTLPAPTMFLINVSNFLRKFFLFIIGGILVLLFLLGAMIRTPAGKLKFDQTLLRLPIFGILLRKVAIARFSRTFSTLVKSGVPILSSLEIVGKTSGNKVIEIAVEKVRNNIREGENIAEPLAKCGVFPPMVIRMIGVGEQTGELEKMLTKIADFYEEQVDAAVGSLTSLIEPLIIVFLGIVVGGIVIAMFLPIFKLTQVIGR